MKNVHAGTLQETDTGYEFTYAAVYLNHLHAVPVSKTLPLGIARYKSATLHAFFDGLISEGCVLDIAQSIWKINQRDGMGLLLACYKDCAGAVSTRPESA